MSERAHIRVSMDGKRVIRELMVDGLRVTELSYLDVIALAMQATSSLRYEKTGDPK